ncbi:sensor histidine kinase [Dyadobacter sp. BHUBP1]|uniref:sensor histidine kinase n=1 Tax=Dyadobacter sp. BHUBP1 TaxID=3424178 RepID=UPI003D357447
MHLSSNLIFRNIAEGFFLLDETGRITTCNAAASAITGYDEAEIEGKPFNVIGDNQSDPIQYRSELDEALERKKCVTEGWKLRKDGTRYWAEISYSPVFDDSEVLLGFCVLLRDITEQKKKQFDLLESEERYRLMVEQVADYGIFMLDTDGRIVSWNEGARRIKGYSAEDIIGKYFAIFYPEEDILNGKPGWELKVAVATGKYEEEGWRLRKDGSRFWANVVITAVYDAEGRLSGFSKVTRDLTERKMSEQALQESSDRYRQLAQELSVANSELSSANRELEQFTAIVSHDLKEPVRTVRSFLYLMNQHVDQQKFDLLKSSIGKGILAAQRMHELIDNLLHYSQISKIGLQRQKLNVEEVIGEAIQNLNDAVEQSGAHIRVQSEVPSIYGDRLQLVQLFQNLLANALKFTNGKKPEVEVKSWMEDGSVRFVVEDNGIGISPENLEKIFEIFRRLHFASQYPGNGVGLAVCKKVVERHRGRIWAESTQGKGASFHIMLPKI